MSKVRLYKNEDILTQGVEPKKMFEKMGKNIRKHCVKSADIVSYIDDPENYGSIHKKDTATVFLFEMGGVVFANIIHPIPETPSKLHHHVRELDDTDESHAHRIHTLITPVKP